MAEPEQRNGLANLAANVIKTADKLYESVQQLSKLTIDINHISEIKTSVRNIDEAVEMEHTKTQHLNVIAQGFDKKLSATTSGRVSEEEVGRLQGLYSALQEQREVASKGLVESSQSKDIMANGRAEREINGDNTSPGVIGTGKDIKIEFTVSATNKVELTASERHLQAIEIERGAQVLKIDTMLEHVRKVAEENGITLQERDRYNPLKSDTPPTPPLAEGADKGDTRTDEQLLARKAELQKQMAEMQKEVNGIDAELAKRERERNQKTAGQDDKKKDLSLMDILIRVVAAIVNNDYSGLAELASPQGEQVGPPPAGSYVMGSTAPGARSYEKDLAAAESYKELLDSTKALREPNASEEMRKEREQQTGALLGKYKQTTVAAGYPEPTMTLDTLKAMTDGELAVESRKAEQVIAFDKSAIHLQKALANDGLSGEKAAEKMQVMAKDAIASRGRVTESEAVTKVYEQQATELDRKHVAAGQQRPQQPVTAQAEPSAPAVDAALAVGDVVAPKVSMLARIGQALARGHKEELQAGAAMLDQAAERNAAVRELEVALTEKKMDQGLSAQEAEQAAKEIAASRLRDGTPTDAIRAEATKVQDENKAHEARMAMGAEPKQESPVNLSSLDDLIKKALPASMAQNFDTGFSMPNGMVPEGVQVASAGKQMGENAGLKI